MDKTTVRTKTNHLDSLSPHCQKRNQILVCAGMQEPLGYAKWERSREVIRRAITSCETTDYNSEDHFRAVTKMIAIGSGAEHPGNDSMLPRYAYYLIAQNDESVRYLLGLGGIKPKQLPAPKE